MIMRLRITLHNQLLKITLEILMEQFTTIIIVVTINITMEVPVKIIMKWKLFEGQVKEQ